MELKPAHFRRTRQGVRDLDQWKGPIIPISGGPAPATTGKHNVSQSERTLSLMGGGALIGWGLGRASLAGAVLGLVGAALVHRGYSGHCQLYDALGMNTGTATLTDPPEMEMAYYVK